MAAPQRTTQQWREARPCRNGCGGYVLLALSQRGRYQPVNPDPDPAGNVGVRKDGTGAWRSRALKPDEPLMPLERRHMPHQATCTPKAKATTPGVLPDGVADLAAWRAKRARR